MFEWFKNLFKKKEEPKEEVFQKVTFTSENVDKEPPVTRYTDEYAEFVQKENEVIEDSIVEKSIVEENREEEETEGITRNTMPIQDVPETRYTEEYADFVSKQDTQEGHEEIKKDLPADIEEDINEDYEILEQLDAEEYYDSYGTYDEDENPE
ncbi:MAG: hypothetical protein IJ875_00435 [Solobacterium sp.]|nr:hypothetical protein [Solobacterium sp.]